MRHAPFPRYVNINRNIKCSTFRLSGWFSFVLGKTLHQSIIYLWNILQHSSQTSGEGGCKISHMLLKYLRMSKGNKSSHSGTTPSLYQSLLLLQKKSTSYPQVSRNPQGSGQRNLPKGFRHVRSEESYCSLAWKENVARIQSKIKSAPWPHTHTHMLSHEHRSQPVRGAQIHIEIDGSSRATTCVQVNYTEKII